MLFDMNMLLSYKQALTASGDSTHGYDRLLNGDDLQRALTLVAFVTSVTGTGSIIVTLKTSADGATWTDAWSSGAIALTAAKRIVNIPLPHGLKRFIKLNYTLSDVEKAVITAGITDAHDVGLDDSAVQKRDQATGEIPDLAAETDALNAAAAAEPAAAAEE